MWRSALLCAFASLALCSEAAELDRLPRLSPDATILAFGDSLTHGIGGSGENYPRRLEQLIARRVINAGAPGETTAQGRSRLPGLLSRERPDLLILCLGINDFLQGIPAEEIRANLLAMLLAAQESGVPVLLLAVPPRGSKTVAALFADAASAGEAVLDQRAMPEVLGNLGLKADLVHLNREGYRQLADRIAARLRALGAVPNRK